MVNTYADQFEFEQQNNSVPTTKSTSLGSNNEFNQQYMVNRQFASIDAVVVKLQSLGLDAYVSKSNEHELSNQLINVDGTVKDFINLAAKKFNYGVEISRNKVNFIALYPAKPVINKIESSVSDIVDVATSKTETKPLPKTQPIIANNHWDYSSNDKYISTTFARWAKQANYQLIWKAENDFEVQSSGSITGGFKTAINDVLISFKNSENPLKAEWYKNNVVVITNLGN